MARLRFVKTVLLGVVGAALLVLPTPVLAQGGGGGGGGGGAGGGRGGFGGMFGGRDAMTPSIDTRQLDRYEAMLGLSKDQKDTVKLLFDGYQEQFKAKAAEVQAKMEAAREQAGESRDPAAWRGVRTMMTEFRETRTKMEDAFFTDFQAVLTPEQAQVWPRVERVRRRETTIGRGLMSGERVDVVKLVEDSKLTPDVAAQLAPTLEQYEADLDRELIQRNKVYDEGMAEMAKLRDAVSDPAQMQQKMQELMTRGRDASVRVRDLNRRYARQVESMLPEEQRWAFEQAVKEASFPMIYRQTGASRQISAAAGFADLDETQKAGLEALRASYSRDVAVLNEKLATATEEQEMTMTVDRMFQRGRGGDEGPVGELRRQRRDLDRGARENLEKLLRPEQVERLPAGRGGDRDDDGGDRRQNRRELRADQGGGGGGR